MKKAWYVIPTIALALTAAHPAFAQEESERLGAKEASTEGGDWKRDFSVTLGTKVWVNEWQIDRFFPGVVFIPLGSVAIDINTSINAPATQKSDVEPVPIPQLAIKYKQLFVTSSYYARTGFDFPTVREDGTATLRDIQGTPQFLSSRTAFNTTTGERFEWDAALGWYVHPYVAFLAGYKEIDLKTTGTVTGTDTFIDPNTGGLVTNPFPSNTFSTDINVSGPTLGIAGSVPIAHGFGIYASYAHGFMDVDTRTVSNQFPTRSGTNDAGYDVAELGFSYTYGMDRLLPHMPLSAATVYAGYRYQTIDTNIPNGGDRKDVTQGFAAGLNLIF